MVDKDQRIHDIAIATLPYFISRETIPLTTDKVYNLYKEVFDAVDAAFTKNHPNRKSTVSGSPFSRS